jgi:subtilisin-like proprotein convertase family protein
MKNSLFTVLFGLIFFQISSAQYQITLSSFVSIAVNDNTIATPYPSTIVANLPNSQIINMAVELYSLDHTQRGDFDILLQSPTGINTILMSDWGANFASFTDANVFFSDDVLNYLPISGNLTGTLSTSICDVYTGTDNWIAPGPGLISIPTPHNFMSWHLNTNANGTWKLFVLDDFSGDPGGNISGGWDLLLVLKSPDNDECAGAITLPVAAINTCSSTTTGTTTYATQSTGALLCDGGTGAADDDIWYKFTAISTSQTVTVVGSGAFDAVVDVRTGNCTTNATIGCADLTASGTETVNLTNLTVGTTYFVRVYSYNIGLANMGSFTVCVSTSAPPNNFCNNAIILNLATPTNSSYTHGATQSIVGCAGTADDDVWYQFTAKSSGSATVSATPTGTDPISDVVLEVYSGICTGLTSVVCRNATSGSASESATFAATSGTSYLFRIYSFGSTEAVRGTFTAAVSTNVLPLELIAFSGKINDQANLLEWETAAEINVRTHIIERSLDGVNWAEIGRLPSLGNNSNYQFRDENPPKNTKYRLRIEDFDEKTTFSPVVALVRPDRDFGIVAAFPSPVLDEMTIDFLSQKEENISLEIYDLTGRLFFKKNIEARKSSQSESCSMADFPSGIYLATVRGSAGISAPFRVVKL